MVFFSPPTRGFERRHVHLRHVAAAQARPIGANQSPSRVLAPWKKVAFSVVAVASITISGCRLFPFCGRAAYDAHNPQQRSIIFVALRFTPLRVRHTANVLYASSKFTPTNTCMHGAPSSRKKLRQQGWWGGEKKKV